jgi:hypothetical protein
MLLSYIGTNLKDNGPTKPDGSLNMYAWALDLDDLLSELDFELSIK